MLEPEQPCRGHLYAQLNTSFTPVEKVICFRQRMWLRVSLLWHSGQI